MAKKKVYGFNEDGYRRVVEATRRVLGTPTKGSQQRRQPPVGLGDRGGCEIAVFLIDSYDYQTGIAVCNIAYRPYGIGAVVGESQDVSIDVIDPAGCFFDEDEVDLVGRWGTAAYMQPTAAVDPMQTPVWVVIGLCCPDA